MYSPVPRARTAFMSLDGRRIAKTRSKSAFRALRLRQGSDRIGIACRIDLSGRAASCASCKSILESDDRFFEDFATLLHGATLMLLSAWCLAAPRVHCLGGERRGAERSIVYMTSQWTVMYDFYECIKRGMFYADSVRYTSLWNDQILGPHFQVHNRNPVLFKQ